MAIAHNIYISAQRAAVQALEVARTQLLEAKRHVEALEIEAKQQAHAAEQAAREASAKLAEASDVSRLSSVVHALC